jgi:aryl-alcohol dehydrogenase-like predicted oxidoreductase
MTSTAAAAGTWRLGDRAVNRLGFGAMRLSGTGAMGRGEDRSLDRGVEVVRRAVELGVNHIDTAAFYFSESTAANDVIRAALAPYPDDLTIVTKVGPNRDRASGSWNTWARPDQLRSHVEQNLTELGLDRLAVVNYRSNGRDDVPAAVAALGRLRDEGLIAHLGVSNVDTDTVERALQATEIVCVQNRHAPGYERSDTDDVLGACARHGIAFVPFFTIAGRAREGAAEEPYDAIRAIAARHQVTTAQVRIAWALALGDHVLAIPGTGDLAHLEQNVAAAGVRLSPDDLDELDRLT